jgi:hypothetical protein
MRGAPTLAGLAAEGRRFGYHRLREMARRRVRFTDPTRKKVCRCVAAAGRKPATCTVLDFVNDSLHYPSCRIFNDEDPFTARGPAVECCCFGLAHYTTSSSSMRRTAAECTLVTERV